MFYDYYKSIFNQFSFCKCCWESSKSRIDLWSVFSFQGVNDLKFLLHWRSSSNFSSDNLCFISHKVWVVTLKSLYQFVLSWFHCIIWRIFSCMGRSKAFDSLLKRKSKFLISFEVLFAICCYKKVNCKK